MIEDLAAVAEGEFVAIDVEGDGPEATQSFRKDGAGEDVSAAGAHAPRGDDRQDRRSRRVPSVREKAAQERRLLWAKRSAIHYLGSYASSKENLRRTMLRRALRKFEGIDEDEAAALAEEAVRFCCENGFLDDGTYARAKAASGEGRGHSKRRIRMSLIAKGIDPETAAEAASQVDDMKAAAAFAKRRRIGPWRKGQGDREDMRREAAALGRAGFPGDIAFRVVTMNLSKAEDLLYGPAAPVS